MGIRQLFYKHQWKSKKKTNIEKTGDFCFIESEVFQCENCLKTRKLRVTQSHEWVVTDTADYGNLGKRFSRRRCANCGMEQVAKTWHSFSHMGGGHSYADWVTVSPLA